MSKVHISQWMDATSARRGEDLYGACTTICGETPCRDDLCYSVMVYWQLPRQAQCERCRKCNGCTLSATDEQITAVECFLIGVARVFSYGDAP